MLIDDVTITVKAGNGGNGAVSFRRNAQTAKGGPDGGNGGNGGSIFFQGSNHISDLSSFQYKKKVLAADGISGKRNNLFGKNAEDLVVSLPLGTLLTDLVSGESLEILDETTRFEIAKGGRGGRGNNEFKSATNQTPMEAEKGEPGQEKELHLELRLIAQVGLIGLPNAGKSSLLASLTNAHPKVGNYPFTTLEPNLGVLDSIVLADIPGLIEGASGGKGLGIKFLKHIEKTTLLLHCIDSTTEDIEKAYEVIRQEFSSYKKSLLMKEEIIVLTKIDLLPIPEREKKKEIAEKLGKKVLLVSLLEEEILNELSQEIKKSLQKAEVPTFS